MGQGSQPSGWELQECFLKGPQAPSQSVRYRARGPALHQTSRQKGWGCLAGEVRKPGAGSSAVLPGSVGHLTPCTPTAQAQQEPPSQVGDEVLPVDYKAPEALPC